MRGKSQIWFPEKMEFWNIFMVILFGIKNNPYSHFFQLFVFLGIRFDIHLSWIGIIWYLSTTIQRKDNYASLYGDHKLFFNSADVYWDWFSEFCFSLIRINLNSIGQLFYEENPMKALLYDGFADTEKICRSSETTLCKFQMFARRFWWCFQ